MPAPSHELDARSGEPLDPTVSPEPEPEVVAEALMEHADALLGYALKRVANRSTAEDLVQDTLVAALAQLHGPGAFAGASALRTWLVGILRHKIVDHFRAQARQPAAPAASDEGFDEQLWFTPSGQWRLDPNAGLAVLDAVDDPGRAAERSELRRALQECIDGLSPGLQRVYVLRELESLDPDEVSEAARIDRDSVAVLLYRARQALRACLQGKAWAP